MATAAQSWSQKYRVGRAMKEVSPPHRTGHIRAIAGTGPSARITCSITGGAPVTLTPAQITLL